MQLFRKKHHQEKNTVHLDKKENTSVDVGMNPLYSDLKKNLHQIKQEVGNSPDVVIREFELGGNSQIQVAVVYTDGLSDKKIVSDFIMRSLMIDTSEESVGNLIGEKEVFKFIKDNALVIGEVKILKYWNELILSILSGDAVILLDGWTEAISGSTKGWESRGITEPSTQMVVRGPKESFSESLGTNISLVRRRIKSSNLWWETIRVGNVTQTDVAILYIKGIANEKLVQEVQQRLKDIKIDGIFDSGNIEELIQDQTITPFPTVYNTERPDGVAANLLEGRIAILVDGTPFVLIVPTIFAQFFQSPEDYYHRFDIAIFLRVLRYVSFIISLIFPSVYVAVITYHQEMIPTPLLMTLAATREGIPFPAFIEAMLMEFTFEILREAGIRIPKAAGQAVSIVGALILGQAAVQAGIVSPAMVIVVAFTGICSFCMPTFDLAISARLIRFVLMILAGAFGFLGLMLGLVIIITHLSSLRSFGIPYLSPFAPFILADQKDAILRLPLWSLFRRPRLISQDNKTRMEKDLQPSSGQDDFKGDGNES